MEIIGAVGLLILAAVLFIITRGSGKSSESIEKRADRNHTDLRSNLESDRDREREEDTAIKRERDRLESERKSSERERGIIRGARKSISGIIKNSKGTGKE